MDTQTGYQHRPKQEDRILAILKNARGWYVDGMIFLNLNPPITQSKARMFGLKKQGYQIEGRFIEGKTWKEYRLVLSPEQEKMPI